jgi:hypothetical protein
MKQRKFKTYTPPEIYNVIIKKGMHFALDENSESTGAKKGDVVKVTSVTCMGRPSNGVANDYEKIRVSNDKYSWNISRDSLVPLKAGATIPKKKSIEFNETAKAIWKSLNKTMGYLAGRWADEKSYEDINDYRKEIDKKLRPFKVTVASMSRSPLGFTFKLDGVVYQIRMSDSGRYSITVIG